MNLAGENSFVLFPLGNKRFALHAATVSELAIPDRLQQFPHCSPLQSGVLVRRGKIMPVCDAAKALLGPEAQPGRFYLIANRRFGSRQEKTAISVSGECELASLVPVAPTGKLPKYITGLLTIGSEIIEIVDLGKLFSREAAA